MTHFRAASLTWETVLDSTGHATRTVEFHMQQSWRHTYYGSPAVGSIIPVAGGGGQNVLDFGDGTTALMYVRVLSVNTGEDYFVGELVTSTGATISHTYAGDGDFEVAFQDAARISNSQNFADQGYRSETIVNVRNGVINPNDAPVSSLPPIVQVADNTVYQLQVPGADPDGDGIRYRIGTADEFISATSSSTVLVAPPGATVSASGLLTWDVTDAARPAVAPGQLWVMTVMVEDLNGSGQVISKTPLDFLFQVVSTATNQAPEFDPFPPDPVVIVGTPIDLAVTAIDPNGDPIVIQVLNPPAGMTTVYHGDHRELHVHFDPNTSQAGQTFVVNFLVTDTGGLTDRDEIVFTVRLPNTAPTAADDTYALNEDTTLTITPAGVLSNDSDAESNPLTSVLVTGPTHGTLTLQSTGAFTYTPAANFSGTDTFTYTAYDGVANSNTANVTLTVRAVNDPPVARNDSHTVLENRTLTVSAAGVLVNDTDVEGSALSAILASGPAHGSLTLNANGGFVYTPAANYHGADTFTYRANDGAANSAAATVTITVQGGNTRPVAAADSYSVREDATLTVNAPGVLRNDTDADGDALQVVLVNGPVHGTVTLDANGSFVYKPVANYTGADSFTYRANDGSANSIAVPVRIAVLPVNDAPVAKADSYSVREDGTLTVAGPGVLANDTDVEGHGLQAVLVHGPLHGSLALSASGAFVYKPFSNYTGADSFTYRASDGAANSIAVPVRIAVQPVNDAPVAKADSYSVNEDSTLVVAGPGVLANDTDVEGHRLHPVLVNGPSHGSLALSSSGGFVYKPDANYSGADSFTYRANDGRADSIAVPVRIAVQPVNDAPVVDNPIEDQDALECEPFDFTVPADTFLDVDGHLLQLVARLADGSALPDWLTFDASSGTFSGTPTGCEDLLDIEVTATDPFGASASDTFTLAIGQVIYGGNGKDTICGGRGGDVIYGGNGNDKISGGDGNDTLYGENGDDKLWGDNGDDLLLGGRGDDEMTGGAGRDVFVLAKSGGPDVVTDFEIGMDLLRLDDGLVVKNVTYVDVDGDHMDDARIQLSNGSVTLLGISSIPDIDQLIA